MSADAVPDARARCFDRFIGQVRIPRGGLNLRVTERPPDHREAFAEGQGTGRKGMAQVMNAHVVEFRAGTDAAPGVLEIGQMGAR